MAQTQVARRVKALRAIVAGWKAAGERVALVPTMGALHEGHLALVRAARRRGARRVIVSIFVNPTQFAPHEDFSKYPRTFAADRTRLTALGTDLIWAPTVPEMYPPGFSTTVSLSGPAAAGLEDAFRPTHFPGVATVVAKLFTQCMPDIAMFGEKDYQQLLVVTRMARDLDLSPRVIGVATVREADGLAMSSRNVYLTPGERVRAAALNTVLSDTAAAVRGGIPCAKAEQAAANELERLGFAVDYVAVRDAATLAPVERAGAAPLRVLAAVRLGAVRLIDNVAA
jgi:pantoate--beta-alanine ligase